ncbi:28S ribosomal protein S5, mitochondrial [Orbilia brochopaga]|uniref:28S ribosomal protein S5, mitochondrial n=1 Tax=Orbilia brochopaga TaxID=3140254 RepID=A0AAV9TXN6_9PEZI
MSALPGGRRVARALIFNPSLRKHAVSRRQAFCSTPRLLDLQSSNLHSSSTSETSTDTKTRLQPYYEQEQLSALLGAEDQIEETDLTRWKPRRKDTFDIPYFTDLSRIDPFLDKAPYGIPKSGRWPSQPIPQMKDVQFKQGEEDDENKLRDLSKLTGLPISYLETLKVRPLVSHRVTNQTRLGKIGKLYILTVAGDGNGMVGIGEASSTVTELASRLSQYQAIKNLKPIARYEDRTIYGNVNVKVGAVELELMSRPPGFGVRCSRYIFEICRCAGISDLAARVTRSRNPMNVIKATIQALAMQKNPDTIARGRGKKMVDVRKAYYGRHIY